MTNTNTTDQAASEREKVVFPEFRTETRWYLFMAAKLFGRKIVKNMYEWRGKIWVTGDVPNPFEKDTP